MSLSVGIDKSVMMDQKPALGPNLGATHWKMMTRSPRKVNQLGKAD
jgi:hypothetical protein